MVIGLICFGPQNNAEKKKTSIPQRPISKVRGIRRSHWQMPELRVSTLDQFHKEKKVFPKKVISV